MTRSVETLLSDIRLLGDMQYEVVQAVRELTRRTITPIEEQVKYGGILFASGVQFAGVFAYTSHVSVEFTRGADIDDPTCMLEGGGKERRHIKLRSVDDIAAANLATYLKLALDAASA